MLDRWEESREGVPGEGGLRGGGNAWSWGDSGVACICSTSRLNPSANAFLVCSGDE